MRTQGSLISPVKVLLFGAEGQLGSALVDAAQNEAFKIKATTKSELDITNAALLRKMLGELEPNIIINAAAYTAVDQAEQNSELAFTVNTTALESLADYAQQNGCRVIHLSTEYVFDGTSSTPYQPNDTANPINIYGSSKRAGEEVLLNKAREYATIIRTSWLYSATHPCFYNTILRLLQDKQEIPVVNDQVATPTSAASLARLIWKACELPNQPGIYHWTDEGIASWYEFASAIRSQAIAANLVHKPAAIIPITTAEFPRPAQRPAYGVLDKSSTCSAFDIKPIAWQESLQQVINQTVANETTALQWKSQ